VKPPVKIINNISPEGVAEHFVFVSKQSYILEEIGVPAML
jgi:hypothetical protein